MSTAATPPSPRRPCCASKLRRKLAPRRVPQQQKAGTIRGASALCEAVPPGGSSHRSQALQVAGPGARSRSGRIKACLWMRPHRSTPGARPTTAPRKHRAAAPLGPERGALARSPSSGKTSTTPWMGAWTGGAHLPPLGPPPGRPRRALRQGSQCWSRLPKALKALLCQRQAEPRRSRGAAMPASAAASRSLSLWGLAARLQRLCSMSGEISSSSRSPALVQSST
mmetsp:Transcript_34200/g.74489  ORF Transcript_34200/g.74489 Transcript_34200/m.74489 type:complete len:225 (-) Transcript_34200:392-1066(-)